MLLICCPRGGTEICSSTGGERLLNGIAHSRIGVHNLAHHATWSKLSLSSCITTPLAGRRRKAERARKGRKKAAIVDLAHHVPNIKTIKG